MTSNLEDPHHIGQLILVATPIGNLQDISQRALDILQNADAILCEDTRVTQKLLLHYGLHNNIHPLHDHNEEERIPTLLQRLMQGQTLALVSDAGTPIVSDPGYRLVRAVIEADIPITSLPGANAVITALTLSGLPPTPFTFLGFPPKKEARKTHFSLLRAAEQAGFKSTYAWYEAPHRLLETLSDLQEIFGTQRQCAVGRELTKRFEEMIRGTLEEVHQHFLTHTPRGEITLLIGPASEEDASSETLDDKLKEALKTHSVKDAAALIAPIIRLPKRIVYNRALELSIEIKNAKEEG